MANKTHKAQQAELAALRELAATCLAGLAETDDNGDLVWRDELSGADVIEWLSQAVCELQRALGRPEPGEPGWVADLDTLMQKGAGLAPTPTPVARPRCPTCNDVLTDYGQEPGQLTYCESCDREVDAPEPTPEPAPRRRQRQRRGTMIGSGGGA